MIARRRNLQVYSYVGELANANCTARLQVYPKACSLSASAALLSEVGGRYELFQRVAGNRSRSFSDLCVEKSRAPQAARSGGTEAVGARGARGWCAGHTARIRRRLSPASRNTTRNTTGNSDDGPSTAAISCDRRIAVSPLSLGP